MKKEDIEIKPQDIWNNDKTKMVSDFIKSHKEGLNENDLQKNKLLCEKYLATNGKI